ncbi:MAG: transcriptional regulator [Syntrophobacteraceae bacterium]
MFTFIESSIFQREVSNYLDDDEYATLQAFLVVHPEAGDVIPGAGGVRKLRWKGPGAGKRGGVRIIYYVRYRPNELWLLTLYAKAKHDTIPAHILKALKERFTDETKD